MFHTKFPKGALAARLAPLAVLPLLSSGPASADSAVVTPERLSFDLHEVYNDDFLTEACGTEVVVTLSGTRDVTLWRNDAGLVERELDRFPGAFITWSAPETGQSVKTRVDLVSHWDYGTGAVLGGPVTFTFQGMVFHLPGSGDSAFAWREVSVGDVDGFEDGVPIVDDGTLVSLVGHIPNDFDFVEAVCSSVT
jgi:hypothetical protein